MSTMIWLVSWLLSPSCMMAPFGLRHKTVVAGPPSVRQMIVNSGGLTLGSVYRVIAIFFACSLPVTWLFYKKGVKTFPLNVEGCRDDSAQKVGNKCSIYAARQGTRAVYMQQERG